uniref:Putative apolipoprotein d/lipocalin n=1 Tax=Rhodnius prolixus TaxID=13249 RepID=R4FLJ1_RHOPR
MISKITFIFLSVSALSLSQAFLFGFGPFTPGDYKPWRLGTCLVPTPVKNFQPEKFFKGHWYVQNHCGNFEWILPGICPTTEYNVTQDGDILELDYHYIPITGRYKEKRAHSNTKLIKNGEGHLPMTFEFLRGLHPMDVPTFILGTDYENWAVVYYCKQQQVLKFEESLILTRKRDDEEIWQPVLDTLKLNKLDYRYFKPTVNTGCAPNEPHL